MRSEKKTVAGYLAERIKEHGIKYMFGIPGGPSIPIIQALDERGIKFIVTSHESAAAVMADVTARLTGVTGLCHGTFGPGATNLSTGVGCAFLDRSPIIAVTTSVSDGWVNRTTQMNIDHQTLFKAVSKATFRLTAGNTVKVIDEAFRIANEEYPGPVHIAIPADVSDKEVIQVKNEGDYSIRKTDQNFSAEAIKEILKKAKKPVIAVGLTAARLGLGSAIEKYLEKNPVPVVVTPMAKGTISVNNRCYAGVLFHALSDRLKPLVENADLIVGVGYDPVEFNYETWVSGLRVVHFGTVTCDLPDENYSQHISSPVEWFELLSCLKASEEILSAAESVRKDIREMLESEYQGFSPVEVIDYLNKNLPDNAIVTGDVGSHLHLMGQQLVAPENGSFILTNGWSSMGFGIPAANAAAINNPGRCVVCVTGDGGFAMSSGEVLTARRYGLKVIIIVLADRELNLIKIKETRKGIKPLATNLYDGILFNSDSFFGVRILHAGNITQFSDAFKIALSSPGPVIIETFVDPASYSNLIAAW